MATSCAFSRRLRRKSIRLLTRPFVRLVRQIFILLIKAHILQRPTNASFGSQPKDPHTPWILCHTHPRLRSKTRNWNSAKQLWWHPKMFHPCTKRVGGSAVVRQRPGKSGPARTGAKPSPVARDNGRRPDRRFEAGNSRRPRTTDISSLCPCLDFDTKRSRVHLSRAGAGTNNSGKSWFGGGDCVVVGMSSAFGEGKGGYGIRW
jgi:hypothetical protein